MEPALYISIIALIVSSIIAVKQYKKSKRLEFFQRRDVLLQKLTDLNNRNSETHSIAARYTLITAEMAPVTLDKEYGEFAKTEISRIKGLVEDMTSTAHGWDELIEIYHLQCSNLTSKKDVDNVESLIAKVQLTSDRIKKTNEIYLSSLYILEKHHPRMADDLSKRDQRKFEEEIKVLEKAIDDLEKPPEGS